MVDRKVVPFDEFYYQLKLMHLFQKHPVYMLKFKCHIGIVKNNLKTFGFFQLKSLGRAKNRICTSGVHDCYLRCRNLGLQTAPGVKKINLK
jgi:hypothetical protein